MKNARGPANKENVKMQSNLRTARGPQIVAWVIAALFISGFFVPLVGMWTNPVLGVWFVGTQKPRRGFFWMLAFAFVPSLFTLLRKFPHTGPEQALVYAGSLFLAAVLGVLPFSFHRLSSRRLPWLFATFPYPLASVVLQILIQPMLGLNATRNDALFVFLVGWIAAAIVRIWNREFGDAKFSSAATLSAGIVVLAAGDLLVRRFAGTALLDHLTLSAIFAWICVGAALFLGCWALLWREKRPRWAYKPESVARLRSPSTGNALRIIGEQGRETFVSSSGERFPIRNGIPDFLEPQDLTGDNLKYNHQYETIGGFYDDTQRVYAALKGGDLGSFFRSYMRLLEAKPGDSVLETSVGTGLNFQYLPRGVELSGIDLSSEMLAGCQRNLRRWQMDANLYLGNAESLPFADSSFDVVYHVGGINFFNDREKAIREMIRVAKPGSLLLIADETEDYVKQVYEKQPGGLFKNRKRPVRPPIDLLPAEMCEVRLDSVMDGLFYALTFRKPLEAESSDPVLAADLAISNSAT
jgi:ubiquinone/menaquinone biosynthesis C-methylase UbiE